MKQWKEHKRERKVKVGGGQERVEVEWTYSKVLLLSPNHFVPPKLADAAGHRLHAIWCAQTVSSSIVSVLRFLSLL